LDLEQMAMSLRPRSVWEAVDLGVATLRRFWAPVYLAWVVCVLPVFVLAYWQLDPWLASLLLWWLLPVFDRVPLHVISRGLFGATPSLKQVLRALPSLWSRYLFRSLVLGRLDPLRSFHLPVQQLEGQDLVGYRRRCAVLNHGNVGVGFLLTTGGWLLEIAVFCGLFVLLGVLLPDGWLGWEPTLMFESPLLVAITASLLFVTVSLLEPVYVAAGFALYLNRRTDLEGWDIELAFRRLRARLMSRSERRRPVAIVMLLAACFLSAATSAQEPTRPPQEVIEEVLSHRDFGYDEPVTRWRRTDEPALHSDPSVTASGAHSPFGLVVGETLRVLMWVVAAGGLLWLVYVMFTTRSASSGAAVDTGPPDTVRGLDVRPESLPDDVAAAAWQRFESGDAAGCLSLLYRGALAILIRDHDLKIAESSTEGDCLRLVQGVGAKVEAQASYLATLTTAWTSCAYGHRTPAAALAKQLCEGWGGVLGGAS